MEGSHAPNDCVVVTLANYFGKTYAEVWCLLEQHKSSLKEGRMRKGYRQSTWLKVAELLKGSKLEFLGTPRRGQEHHSGIVRMCRPQRKNGHLVFMRQGLVFETDGKSVYPIKEYRQFTGFNLKGIWR